MFRDLILALCVGLSMGAGAVAATGSDPAISQKQRIEDVQHEVKLIEDSLAEIRRDQLNYKLQSDLLKESYNTSVQTIQVVAAMATVVFAILGFFGLKDIGGLRKEYAEKLEQLGTTKNQLELELGKLKKDQASVREDLKAALQASRASEDKIKVLQMQEQAGSLQQRGAWDRAISYIDIGLEIDSNNLILLRQKAQCLIKLKRYDAALTIFDRLREIEPDGADASGDASNAAEILLVTRRFQRYAAFRDANLHLLGAHNQGATIAYLACLEACLQSDVDSLVATIKGFAKEDLTPPQKQWIPGWDYGDAQAALAEIPDSDAKRIFLLCVQFFSGAISVQQLLPQLP